MSFVAGFYIVQVFTFFTLLMVVVPVPLARWWSAKMRTASPWRRARPGMAAADAMTGGIVRRVGAAGIALLTLGSVTTFLPALLPIRPWIVLSTISFAASAVMFALAVRYALYPPGKRRTLGVAALAGVAATLLLSAIVLSLVTA